MTKAVPILTYHHVNPLEGDMVTVSVNHFEEQMSFLQRKRLSHSFCCRAGGMDAWEKNRAQKIRCPFL